MASADEFIREAQYALRNISHGSTDEKKYRARAEKYAKLVIRKYPVSIEASQARQILDHLNIRVDVRPPISKAPQADAAADFAKSHSMGLGHTTNKSSAPRTPDARFGKIVNDEEWRDLFRRFIALSRSMKNVLGLVAVFTMILPGGFFVLFGLLIFYAFQLPLLKKHLNVLLKTLGSD